MERVYLPSDINATLSSLDFIREGLNICILGPSDSGKAYLAKALGIQVCLNFRAMYHHCEEFLETMIALKQTDYSKYQKKVRFYLNLKLDLLILDDLGTEMLNTFTVSRLFQVLNERALRRRSTIISTNLSLKDFRDLYSERIFSRITSSYTLLKFTGSDIRIRRKISGSP